MPKRPVSKAKAKEILEHGSIRGRAITKKQRGLFGALAGGSPLKKYHNSPSSYDETALGETPPRLEYKAEQENLHATESKKAGGIPVGVKQADGTENLRAEGGIKSAGRSSAGGGRTRWPSEVDHFNDSGV